MGIPWEFVAGQWEHLRKRSFVFIPICQLYPFVIGIEAVWIFLKAIFASAHQSFIVEGTEKDGLSPSIFEDC